jgi:hypothetical protein
MKTNKCNISNGQLFRMTRVLTLYGKSEKKQQDWIDKGFNKISQDRLVEYWKKRIDQNEEDKHLACVMAQEMAKNNGRPVRIMGDLPELISESSVNDVKPVYPPAKRMATSLAQSVTQWVKNGFKLTPEDKLQERLDICKGCEFWDKEALGGTGRCRKCGCSTQAKLRLAHEKCPIDKWGPIDQTPLTQTP